MTTPPKKLSFSEEMELLKKQKALTANQQARSDQPVNAVDANASDIQSRLDKALAEVMLAAPVRAGAKTMMSSRLAPAAEPVRPATTTPILQEDAHQLKIKAMEAAFSKIVGEHQPTNSKKDKTKASMLFCTSCRLTTPGENVKPGNAGIGLALGMIGLIPGIAYFFYQQMGSQQQCTHCQATTLVAMNSVQARTLCGDQHEELMAAGWPAMRRAERDHIRNRRLAIAKIMVVGVIMLGASLYFLRAPSSPLNGAVSSNLTQSIQPGGYQ
jgi:hypothetical protein